MTQTFEIDLTRNIDSDKELAEIACNENTFNKKYPAITLGALIMLNGIPVIASTNFTENYRLLTPSEVEVPTLITDYSNLITQTENVCNYNLLTKELGLSTLTQDITLLRKELSKNVLSFKTLIHNWDGYGAIPPSVECAVNTLSFLNSVNDYAVLESIDDYYPNPNGTITFIWEKDKNTVQVEFGAKTMSYFVVIKNEKHFFNKIEVSDNEIAQLVSFIKSV